MPNFQKSSTCRIPHLVCNTKQFIFLGLEHFWQSVSFGQVFLLVYSDYVRTTRAGNPSACDLHHCFWQSNGDNSMMPAYSLKKMHGEHNHYKARREKNIKGYLITGNKCVLHNGQHYENRTKILVSIRTINLAFLQRTTCFLIKQGTQKWTNGVQTPSRMKDSCLSL